MGWKDYPIYEMEVIKIPWFQTTNEYFHGISMGYIYIYLVGGMFYQGNMFYQVFACDKATGPK